MAPFGFDHEGGIRKEGGFSYSVTVVAQHVADLSKRWHVCFSWENERFRVSINVGLQFEQGRYVLDSARARRRHHLFGLGLSRLAVLAFLLHKLPSWHQIGKEIARGEPDVVFVSNQVTGNDTIQRARVVKGTDSGGAFHEVAFGGLVAIGVG